jgi:trimethylamine--corrinoid protein Co-methyltransferase
MHDGPMTEACIELAKLRVPIMVYPMPLTGGTAPVTLGGTILIHNVEFLSGLTLFQAVNPGAPIIYGTGASQLDMLTGRYGHGADGMGLQPALGELARFYNLPVNMFGPSTSAYEVDALYGHEATATTMLSYLSGADEIYSVGLLGSAQVLSLDKMVMDNYLIQQIEDLLTPINVDEEHLQAELIERVGVGGSFLTQRETRDYTRREYKPMWPPANQYYVDIVHQDALHILHNHQPPPLPEGAAEKIDAIVARADRELGK